jgi:hypothetical protein
MLAELSKGFRARYSVTLRVGSCRVGYIEKTIEIG